MNNIVSVIIPVFNRVNLIGETLDSIIAQSYTDWECIIIDDGSTDDTFEYIKNKYLQDPRFKLFRRPKEMLKGGNAARNFGFEKSSGKYIQWFDSDDVMLPLFLEKRINAFTKQTNFVISAGYDVDENLKNRQFKLIKKDENLKNRQFKLIKKDENLFKALVLNKLKIVTQSVLFKRTFLQNKNMFKEDIFRGQETEFFSRLFYKVKSNEYEVIEEALYLYRQHRNTKSSKNKHTYNANFKQSLAYISVENMKRGFDIKDKHIVQHHYQLFIKYFFESLNKKDKDTAKKINNLLGITIVKNNFLLGICFYSLSRLFIFGNRSVYFIEKSLKNYQFNNI